MELLAAIDRIERVLCSHRIFTEKVLQLRLRVDVLPGINDSWLYTSRWVRKRSMMRDLPHTAGDKVLKILISNNSLKLGRSKLSSTKFETEKNTMGGTSQQSNQIVNYSNDRRKIA